MFGSIIQHEYSKFAAMGFKYQKVENDSFEDVESIETPPQSALTGKKDTQFRRLLRKIYASLLSWRFWKDLAILSLAFWGFISLLHHAPIQNFHVQVQPKGCDCGSSTTEALALGCKYDSLAAAWLPEHCRDDELTAEFEKAGDGPNGEWLYFRDTKHRVPITLEEIALLADEPGSRFHMTENWHKVHCIYYWRKEHRARFNGKMVEPRSDTEEHIHHCGMVFMSDTYGTIAGVALNTDED